jgi:hypothetical protein
MKRLRVFLVHSEDVPDDGGGRERYVSPKRRCLQWATRRHDTPDESILHCYRRANTTIFILTSYIAYLCLSILQDDCTVHRRSIFLKYLVPRPVATAVGFYERISARAQSSTGASRRVKWFCQCGSTLAAAAAVGGSTTTN